MSVITVAKLQDMLNDIERNAYERILDGEEITRAYALAGELGENIVKLKAENEKLQAENKNLIANYEMLRESYMDSKQACEHLFTDLKRCKSLLRAKLPERELMLIDEIQKLLDLAKYAILCSEGDVRCEACPYHDKTREPHIICTMRRSARELGVEVDL